MKEYQKIEGEITLIDTYNRDTTDYIEDFKQYCEDNEYVIRGEGTDMEGLYLGGRITFYDWYNQVIQEEDDDFWNSFRKAINAETTYTRCLITGAIGRWDGSRKLGINLCDNLWDAVSKCLKDAYDVVLKVKDNVLYVENHHHDGTNYFEIRLVNADNYDKLLYWDDNTDGDLDDFVNNPNNFNIIYWNYFGLA